MDRENVSSPPVYPSLSFFLCMDPQAQAPHNLPFEPDDLDLDRELESIAPTQAPRVQAPELPPLAPSIPPSAPPARPTAPPTPPANFLSGEPTSVAAAPLAPRPPSSGPKQPEDMFGALEASGNRPVPRVMPTEDPLATSKPAYGKYILGICGLIAGLGLLAAGLWYVAIHRPAKQAALEAVVPAILPDEEVVATTTPELIPTAPLVTLPVEVSPSPLNGDLLPPVTTPPVTTPPAGTNVPPPTAVSPEPTPEEPPTPIVTFVDTDGDELSDTREQELGTDPRNPDTDADGLTDGEEVLKYGTNPLKTDTDGDTFGDGLEVKGGYNPRGPGNCSTPTCTL